MSYRIAWCPPALAVFYELRSHSAMLLDRTVVRYAETGQGELRREDPYLALRGGGYDAIVVLDRRTRTLNVVWIRRHRR